ncbi:hypothetical protein ACFHYQ_19620 [Sphaerimonospora cavernae]|uniref:DUF1707 domain-containing protein n=1 Tax=Sphaerimonospora cavernae TaxID=1740611 RepID=A0ABV6U8Q6_9ACTN
MPETASQPPGTGHPNAGRPTTAQPTPAWPQPQQPYPPQARPPQPVAPSPREDLRAVLAARRDLGPEYEDALVDSFLDKLDVEIGARVRNEVAAQAHYQQGPHQQQTPPPQKKDSAVGVAMGSLALGIPLTGIAVGNAGTPGLLLAWGGIVAVNLAYALGRRRQR